MRVRVVDFSVIVACMLIAIVMSIAAFGWKLNKGLGYTMVVFYFVHLVYRIVTESLID